MIDSPMLKHLSGYIGGQWCDADNGETFAVLNPANGKELARVPAMGEAETERAIAAARAIQAAAGEWNVARAREGYPPARLSVGVDYGSVVMGDIGSARRLEFATIGDAVNLASKLESATRGLGAAIVVSEATARQAEAEDPNRALALLAGFSPVPGLELPGHAPVDARALKR
ncbi:MAG: aldehyde dehydrogenase family protein [Alphaproteobacteria bacterium]